MSEAAQKKIAEYMIGKTHPSQHDILCFRGMIETGEATPHDFEAVGGWKLAYQVAETLPSEVSQ